MSHGSALGAGLGGADGGSSSGSQGGGVLAQDGPRHIRAQFFAKHGLSSRSGGLLDSRAVLCGDIAAAAPHAWRARGHAEFSGQCAYTANDGNGAFKGCDGGGLVNHVRDSEPTTNVMQGPGLITDVNNLAERLKWARLHIAMLSQAELAKAAGVTQGTVANIEAGIRKSPRELLAIARAAGVHAEWLKSGKGPRSLSDLASKPPIELNETEVEFMLAFRALPIDEQREMVLHAMARAKFYRDQVEQLLAERFAVTGVVPDERTAEFLPPPPPIPPAGKASHKVKQQEGKE